MLIRSFALVSGVFVLLTGILGFIPGFIELPPATAPSLVIDSGYGYLFGLFPTNVLFNILRIAIGVVGIVAYRNLDTSRYFARFVAASYGVFALMGAFPALNTFFGFLPIFGNDVWFHAVTAVAAAAFGFVVPTLKDAEVVQS